jgi:polar amino acid transport system substrate-binding protein
MKWIVALLSLVTVNAGALTLTTEEYPPFNFSKDGGKTITGSATDVMNEVLKRTGIKATISLYPWERAYQSALDDKNTCVYSATRTEAREKLFKWVGPLASDSWTLYAKADSPITAASLDDVKKYSIGGYQGDAKAIFLKEKGLKLEETMKDEQNVKKLDAGRIDLWAASSSVGPWLAKSLGVKLKPVVAFKDVQLYAACNLGMADADITKMNEAVKAIQADGTLDKFIKAYQ